MAKIKWFKSERPREKLLKFGANALSDAELLAIFLRTGSPDCNVIELAHQLIDHFGSLNALLNAEQKQCLTLPGIGPAKYCQLKAINELAQRSLAERLYVDPVLQSADQIKQYLQFKLRPYPYEVFACLFIDKHYRLIAFEELFKGGLDRADIHPRELVRRVLHHNAAALILAHNHPSGQAQASESDRQITAQLKQLLSWLDVQLLDHIIIAQEKTLSMAEQGDL